MPAKKLDDGCLMVNDTNTPCWQSAQDRGSWQADHRTILVYKQCGSRDDLHILPHTDLSTWDYLRIKSRLLDTPLQEDACHYEAEIVDMP